MLNHSLQEPFDRLSSGWSRKFLNVNTVMDWQNVATPHVSTKEKINSRDH